MATIYDLIRNTQAIDMRQIVEDTLRDTASILKRFQLMQMRAGYNSAGKPIGAYKNKAYEAKKRAMNPGANGRVDLFLEGYFQGDAFVDIRNNSVVFESGNEKTIALTEKYGEEIFGLNDETASEYARAYLAPYSTKKIIEKILR